MHFKKFYLEKTKQNKVLSKGTECQHHKIAIYSQTNKLTSHPCLLKSHGLCLPNELKVNEATKKQFGRRNNQITRAQSPAPQIRTAESLFNFSTNFDSSFQYSVRTYDAASSARLASTNARQHPLNPAPLNRAPNMPGAFRRMWYSLTIGFAPIE